MLAAIAEGELARGTTGDNPWVGCVIVVDGAIVARGHTQGPGEDHAEIVALRRAMELGVELARARLYSTLEPCSFHGRTPACARVIAESGVRTVVVGIGDPHPRVDGVGVEMVRAAGVEVIEGIQAPAIRRQLAAWIVEHHPHEVLRRARSIAGDVDEVATALVSIYGIDEGAARGFAERRR